MSNESSPAASILVVDDTIENLRLLGDMLGAHGYDVRPVATAAHALLAAERDPPDVILLDIGMPGMDGYEVCARLKGMAHVRDVPVIFLTALTDTADKVKAFNAGGVDYITKPFQFDEVLARVTTHVALRRARVDLLRNYERLRALEQLRDDLVHMVVHDMRSPLMAVMGHLEFLQIDLAGMASGQSLKDLEAALHAAGVLNRMAGDLLDVSRLEAGRMPIERTRCDLAAMAGKVRASLGAWDRDRAIDVRAPSAVEAVCDGRLVHRVMENLVGNAIKHTPRDGRIEISVRASGGCARIEVADEGPGVPSDARTRIFEKFGTVAARRDHRYHSAGLGLAFCKLAVDAHGGTIGVDDRAGGGSVFWLELPVAAPPC